MIDKFILTHCGYFKTPRGGLIAGGGWEREPMPFLFGIAFHSEFGPILIDAPFDKSGAENVGRFAAGLLRRTGLVFSPDWSVASRLEQLSIDPAELQTVLMTHLHSDHTGGMKSLPGASFHTSRREWEVANENPAYLKALANGYSTEDYQSLESQMVLHDDIPHIAGGGPGLDVLDDGSIEIFALPGHTPGHCGYRLHLSSGNILFFAGDAAHTVAHAQGKVEAGFLPPKFADSMPQLEDTLVGLRTHLDAHPDEELFVCHDFDLGARAIAEDGIEWS